MRHHPNPPVGSCSIISSPELCPEIALYKDRTTEVYVCEKHRHIIRDPVGPQQWPDQYWESWNGSSPELKDRGPHSCYIVLPWVICPEPPTWDYLEVGGDRHKLCETHANLFRSYRPTSFDLPEDQGGYDAKRICICSVKALMTVSCKCGRS